LCRKVTQGTEQRRKTKNKYKKTKDEQKGTFTRLQFASRSQWRVASARNRQKGTFTRPQVAPNSHWRVIKEKHRQEHGFTRHGE